jgi:uncharacterized protein (DUF983 family)
VANGKDCPHCGKDIGVWAIFAAGSPSRIRCPSCHARLKYDGAIALMAIPYIIVLLCAVIVHEAAVDAGIPRPGAYVAVLVIVTWIPIELLLTLFLRDRRTLHLVEPGKKKHGEPR